MFGNQLWWDNMNIVTQSPWSHKCSWVLLFVVLEISIGNYVIRLREGGGDRSDPTK